MWKFHRKTSNFATFLVLAVGLGSAASAGTVKYLDADGTEQSVTEYTLVNADSATAVTWSAGTYVVGADYNSDGEINAADAAYAQAQDPQLPTAFTITGGATASGDVKLILADGFTLTANGVAQNKAGINVSNTFAAPDTNYLTVYAQSKSKATMGVLNATGGKYGAGIGSAGNQTVGSHITINGGIVNATGGQNGAGIGGGYDEKQTANVSCCASGITINGGIVTAAGGSGGAGIGGGRRYGTNTGAGSNITINGGTVTATGNDAAGIGGGRMGKGSDIAINGGIVTAIGGMNKSGIGSGGTSNTGAYAPSNIKISAALFVRADGNNPPTTKIANNGTDDLASKLDLKRYVVAAPAGFPYVDAEGFTKTIYTFNSVADSTSGVTWDGNSNDGFYVVGADYDGNGVINYADSQVAGKQTSFTLSGGVTVSGEVKVIVADGFTLTVSNAGADGIGSGASTDSLTVYGQSGQSGTLSAAGGNGGAGVNVAAVTIYGAGVTSVGEGAGAGISSDTLTVKSGTLAATGGATGDGISAAVSAKVSGGLTIKAGADSSSLVGIGHSTTTDLHEALAGKRYAAVTLATVKYLDEEGQEQTVESAFTLIDNETAVAGPVTWEASWYVAGADYNSDGSIDAADAEYAVAHSFQANFTITGGVKAGGALNLILVDGFTLTLDASETDNTPGFNGNMKNVSVYGQSNQTGTWIVKAGSDGDGITSQSNKDGFKLCGGIVKAYGGDSYGNAMYRVTVMGGSVYAYASGSSDGCNWVDICGGTFYAYGGDEGGYGASNVSIYDGTLYGYGGVGGTGVDCVSPYGGKVYGYGGDNDGSAGGDGVTFEWYCETENAWVCGIGGKGEYGGAGISFPNDVVDGGTFNGIGGEGTEVGGDGFYGSDYLTVNGGAFSFVGGKGATGGNGICISYECIVESGTLSVTGGVGTVTGGNGFYCSESITFNGGEIEAVAGAAPDGGAALMVDDGMTISATEGIQIRHGAAAPGTFLTRSGEDITEEIAGDKYVRFYNPEPETASTVVTTLDDVEDIYDGQISLREAINYAGTGSLGSVITFSDAIDWATEYPTLTIYPASAIKFEKGVTIDGALKTGAVTVGKVTLDGGSACRILNNTSDEGLTVRNVDFQNGDGAIRTEGSVTVSNAKFINNTGSAIYAGGAVTATDCFFFGNSGNCGGAIYVGDGAVLTLVNNTITGNTALYGGAAFYLDSGSAKLVNNIIVGNAISAPDSTVTGYGVNVLDAASAALITTAGDGSVTRSATKMEVFGTETPLIGKDGKVTVLANAKTEGVYVYGGASVTAALAWSADGVSKNYINGTTGADTQLNPADRIRDSKVYAGIGSFPATYTIVLSEGEAYRDAVSPANKITAQVAALGLTCEQGRWVMDGFMFITTAESAIRFADAANVLSVSGESNVTGSRYGFYLDGTLDVDGNGQAKVVGSEAGVFGTVAAEPYAIAKSGETELTWKKVNTVELALYSYASGEPAVIATSVILLARMPSVTYRDFVDGVFVSKTLTNDYTLIKSDVSASVNWSAGTYVVGSDCNMDGVLDYRDAEYAAENGLATAFNYNGVIVEGAVKLVLVDGFTLISQGGNSKAGVRVTGVGNSFTVYGQVNGTGRLNAIGGLSSAGIGGTSRFSGNGDAANITINGGTVTAKGGNYGAGIGGGQETSASNITINAGTVIATGAVGGAGIGGGGNANFYAGTCHGSIITITGGKVSAKSGDGYGAAIGGGRSGRGSDIRITGGEVFADAAAYATTAIGNGAKTNGVTTEPATNIFVDALVILKADGNNPPTTEIAHASDTDLAEALKTLRYVTAKDTAVARIGATKYYTLQDALAAGDGKVIELLRETNEDCALSTAAGTTNIVDAMGLRYSNANSLTNDGTLTLANSAATEVQFAFGGVVNRGEIATGHLTDGEPMVVVDGAFSGADGKIVVDMTGTTDTTLKLISATDASDYGNATCSGEYLARRIGNNLMAIHLIGLTFGQTEGGEFTVSTGGAEISSGTPVPAGDTVTIAFAPAAEWQADTAALQLRDATNGFYDVSYFTDVTLAGAKFAMPAQSTELTVAFKIRDSYREDLQAAANVQYVASSNSLETLRDNRLTDRETDAALREALDACILATNAIGVVYRPYEGDVVTNGLAATIAQIEAAARARSESKPYDLVIANDFAHAPFENVTTNENGEVMAFTFGGAAYTNGVNAFSSFSAAAVEASYAPFATNIHVFGCQTIAAVPTMKYDWALDLVTCETEPGVTNAAVVTVAKTATEELVPISAQLKAIAGEGAIVLSVTNGTAGAAAYKTALEGLIGAADVSVAYVNVEAECKDETGPKGEPVVSQDVTVTDSAKPDDAGAIVLPGVDTDGKVTVDVKQEVTNDVVVAGKLNSREWDVVIVNETTNTLTVGAIAAKLNVLITNVTEVGKILTLENVIAGQKIKIDNNGHLEANVYATDSLEIRNAAINTLVGSFRSGGAIDITGEYGSLSNVVIDAAGRLTISGTNIISGPVDLKSGRTVFAPGTMIAWSVANDNPTAMIDFADVAKSPAFGVLVDADQLSGALCGAYTIASNATAAVGKTFALLGPGAFGETIVVNGGIRHVGAKAFALFVNAADELVLTVSYGNFKVGFDAMGGAWSDGTIVTNTEVSYLTGYRRPSVAPTRAGYTFLGWFDGVTNGSTQIVADGAALRRYADHTIFAKWSINDATTFADAFAGAAQDAHSVTNVRATAVIAKSDLVMPDRQADGKAIVDIGAAAFTPAQYAGAVTSVRFGAFVREVGRYAFSDCKDLTNATFAVAHDHLTGEKVTLNIGYRAFENAGLKSIVFPAGGSYRIGHNSFNGVQTVEDVYLYGDIEVADWAKSPFRHIGEGLADGQKVKFHLSPRKAADAAYVAAITNGMDNACVMLDQNVLGTVAHSDVTVGASEITLKFTLAANAPWKTVTKDTTYLLFSGSVSEVIVGTGKVLRPVSVEQQADGSYFATFAKPAEDTGFFRVCVGE